MEQLNTVIGELGPDATQADILDALYTRIGASHALDGSKVCVSSRRSCGFPVPWRHYGLALGAVGLELPMFSLAWEMCVVLRQEAFKKNAPGFLHLGLVGGSEAAAALHMLVKQSADPIKVGTFRGFEALIPPDVARVVLGHHFIGSII